MKLVPGLYEDVITQGTSRALNGLGDDFARDVEALETEAAPHVLGRYLFDALVRALHNLPEEGRLEAQVALTNSILKSLSDAAPNAGIDGDEHIASPAELLLSLRRIADARLGSGQVVRPTLPLRHSDLLVNGPRDLRIGNEIRRELASADSVDIIISFVKFNGFVLLRPDLTNFATRCPGKLRVLTTTYMGATEVEAVEALVDIGAEVRLSYDTRRTRLHAKAWLFHRESGHSTALVGSSNLSPSALLDGCEWNVRLSSTDNRTILNKFRATFDQYWREEEVFEAYNRERFLQTSSRRNEAMDALAQAVQLRPYPHQQVVLDALVVERQHGFRRNLVVAATGTGKTIVAALDYARLRKTLRQELGRDPTLLFVAHREEILKQSVARFRAAVRDGHFGELLVARQKPLEGRHVFATIQSLHKDRLATVASDAYDVIVVDEFHHAAAKSYEALLNHFKPRILLGLTATPERSDGQSILQWFDGRIAAELRLWDALDLELVSPFHYFGIHDDVDLSTVDFNNGRYDLATLDQLYTGDHERAKRVLRAIKEHVRDPKAMRAIGFCVSVKHAEFMAAYFEKQGLASVAIHADTLEGDRTSALQRLRDGSVNVVFAVDLLNEGVDVPAVDTILFLRPTESATVFLQQLGRGLRLEDGKTCLTVLDFIGNANRKFRFVDRFQALTRGTRASVRQAIEDGFPHLPAGCDIRLDRQSHDAVLKNIRASITNAWSGMASDLRMLGDVRLPQFLKESNLALEDFYSAGSKRCYAALRHDAGLRATLPDNEVTRAIPRLLYVDDDGRIGEWKNWLSQAATPVPNAKDPFQLMLFAALGFIRRPVTELGAALAEVWADRDVREEIVDVLTLLADRRRRPTCELSELPFRVHATYSRDEISAGLLQVRKEKLLRTQGGVFKCDDAKADILYVELDKDPKHYTPTTLYDDRIISPTRMQWESQSRTRADSETGRRYQTHAKQHWRILVFVRQRAQERGFTSPYLFLGLARYVTHKSEKPMQVQWELEHAVPPEFFQEVKIAAG